MSSPVFVDVATGIDDALALIYLLASPDADVWGIASTGGNIHVEQVCVNNLGLLELCGAPSIPVSRGADEPLHGRWSHRSKFHGPSGLGYAELPASDRRVTGYDATAAWVRAARSHPGTLTGLVTGPLTNLALALRREPALPTLLRRLVIMGGAFGPDTNPMAEWNIRVDPEAADEVLAGWSRRGQLPIVCGLDLTRRVAMTPDILARLSAQATGAGGSRLMTLIEDAMRFYFESHEERGYGYTAFMHDPLAAAVALDPQLISTRAATVDVELANVPTRGVTVADTSGNRKPNALIGVHVDAGVFFDRFVERVGTFVNRVGA
ncbi:nucleoside hydrolase [Mycobacterium malmoense]|uniref:nucleoside hydrolase n=1 Tax=Mycobacterium malmoense TaxID=1780 RepID=UPI00080B3A0E|nr:nucleoside hydrolase [Mycobacterium malmoense]OCB18821.1 nucleoside hydrolase [Mycobacterium malmoense]